MKTALKRTLSLMLTVVMLVSCWVFTAPKADAATAGNYTVVVKFTVNDATDSKHMEDSWIKIDYKKNNGTGDSASHTWDLDNSSLIGTTGNKTVSQTVAGYPTKVYLHLDQQGTGFAWANTDNLDVKVYEVTVQGTSVWTGSVQTASEKLAHTEEASISNSPYAASITAISGDTTVNVSTSNATVTKSYTLGTVKDQYGVNWYQDASWDTATTSNGVSFSSGTLTVPSSSNRSSNYTITLKETCGNASNTKTVTIGTFDYKVTFYDENGTTVLKAEQTVDYGASATAPNNPTKAYDSSKHYAFAGWTGDGYTNITTGSQTKTVKASYTGTSHTNTSQTRTNTYLKSAATCTADAVYYYKCTGCAYKSTIAWTDTGTATGHNIENVDWSTDTTYHWKVCKNNCGTPQEKAAHSGAAWSDWNPDGSVGGVAKHTKTCGTCGYVLSGDHTYTAQTVKAAALKDAATCDGPAVYYYSCSVCGRVESNDNHTFTDGSALLVHDLGDWTQFTGIENYKGIGESEATNHDGTLQHKAICQDFASHVKYENHTWNIGYNPESLPAGVTPKEGYSYDGRLNHETGVSTGEHYYICPSCNYLKYETHSFAIVAAECVEPTCTSDGYDVYRCTCGYSYTIPVQKLEHTYPNDGAYEIVTPKTCTTDGIKQRTCSVCGTVDTQPIPTTGHDRYEVPSTPGDGVESTGSVYFKCHNCSSCWAATYNDSTEEYEPSSTTYPNASAAKRNSEPVPAPEFNSFVDDDESTFGPEGYAYETRGVSLKIASPYEYTDLNTTQGTRWTASLHIPEDVEIVDLSSETPPETNKYITDFGFVYTLTQYAEEDEDNFIIGGTPNMFSMSVAQKNSGKSPVDANGNWNGTWTGVTLHENDDYDGQTLTFNLVINIKAKNWKKNYCSRAYIKYMYNGFEYTVYDSDPMGSSRNVAYIAQCVVDNVQGESLKVRNYCQSKILNHLPS